MRPNDTPQPLPKVSVPTRDGYSLVSPRQTPASPDGADGTPRAATANLARQQIDAIYADNSSSTPAADTTTSNTETAPAAPNINNESPQAIPQNPIVKPDNLDQNQPKRFDERRIEPIDKKSDDLKIDNPYERTHDDTGLKSSDENWKQYHSAWQQYYQQYFHRYYSDHLSKVNAQLDAEKKRAEELAKNNGIAGSSEYALDDIRSRIRGKVRDRAKKVRRSQHFVPIMAAVAVMVVFTFLQYNRVFFSNIQAYVTPGNIEPANIIVDPNIRSTVGNEPLLVIPKINVQVPVVWNASPDHESQMAAMENGVAWFGIPGANSKPGQIGNTVLSGHSSNDFFETGDYKFVFAPLEKLEKDDTIEIHYQGTLYTYVVTKKEVVLPTEVGKLIYDTDKPMLTLITCTPLGTALKRLLVTAEQVSPSPGNAKAAPSSDAGNGNSVEMPGTEPTLLERAFTR